jgi:hypothetical protein
MTVEAGSKAGKELFCRQFTNKRRHEHSDRSRLLAEPI